MRFDIITIFPKIFDSYFGESIIKRAQTAGLIDITVHDLRQWAVDKHKTIDDAPYGGGAGMILKIEPLYQALRDIKNGCWLDRAKSLIGLGPKTKVVLLSAKGKKWTQALARDFVKADRIILLCGRYEGVDERIKYFIDEEISIGDYVLTGGELAAAVMVDSVARLLPGVLGNEESPLDESHDWAGILEYPQYTRPAVFRAGGQVYKVPEVLLGGNHQVIEKWRRDSKKVLN